MAATPKPERKKAKELGKNFRHGTKKLKETFERERGAGNEYMPKGLRQASMKAAVKREKSKGSSKKHITLAKSLY